MLAPIMLADTHPPIPPVQLLHLHLSHTLLTEAQQPAYSGRSFPASTIFLS